MSDLRHKQSMDAIARRALLDSWGLALLSLRCVAGEEGRQCFRAATDHGHFFVKVQENLGEYFDDIVHGLRVQQYVREQGLPTNDVVRTTSGELCAVVDDHGIVVEPWVQSEPNEPTSRHWEEFGRIVGQLHSLPVSDELAACPSKMDPRRNLERLRSNLSQFTEHIPREYRASLERFIEFADQLDDLPEAPRSLIHSDLAWSNVVMARNGQLLLVDFEGAGFGPAVVDLVEVTTYLCRGPSASGPLMEDAARAFYRGYREHRALCTVEIELLERAHLFHQLYYLENSLTRGDYDFLRRMSARLDNWQGGVLSQLAEVMVEDAPADCVRNAYA